MDDLGLLCCAADEVLAGLGFAPLSIVEKAVDPLTPAGFDATVVDLLREVRKVATGKDKRALERALKKLDRDWAKMTPVDRSDAIRDAARTFLGLTEDVAPAVAGALANRGVDLVTATKAAAASAYRLRVEPIFDGVDQRILDAAARHQALFVRDQYGKRAQSLSQDARTIVASGLERGLDRYDIAEELASTLNQTSAARADSYWQLIASVFAARSRSWGTLRSFDEAGITSYEIHAVLDEVTTEICRFLDGQVFSTSEGIARFDAVAAESDPERVKDLQPWAYVARDDAGDRALFYKDGGERRPIARVDSPAAGKKDAVGSYSNAMSGAQLAAAGFHSPPYHGLCRTNVLPRFESVQVPAVAPPFGAPEPALAGTDAAPPPRGRKPKMAPAPKAPPEREDPSLPPTWSIDRSKPLVEGMPMLLDRTGYSIRPNDENFLGKRQIDALRAIYAERAEDLAQKVGGMDRLVDETPSFDRAAYEDAVRKAIPKWSQIQKHATERSEVSYLDESAVGKLLPARKIDPDKVAGHVVGYRSSILTKPDSKAEHEELPIVFRWRGKLIVEAGAERIVAERAKARDIGGTGFYVRVVDLDKAAPKRAMATDADRAALAKGAADAFRELAAHPPGATTPIEAQRKAREAIRDLLRSEGIETRDDYLDRKRMGGPLVTTDAIAGASEFKAVKRSDMIRGALAYHTHGGTVAMVHGDVSYGAATLAKIAKNPKEYAADHFLAESDLEPVATAIHEELHGASKMRSQAYRGNGVGMEEAATEILARRIVRKLAGNPKAFSLPDVVPDRVDGTPTALDRYPGSYNDYIGALLEETAKVVGIVPDIHDRVEEALLATRRWDGKNDYWEGPDAQIRTYVDALGIKSAKDRKRLVDALSTTPALRKAP